MSHFDPSWCARINAHRRAPSAATPPAEAARTEAPSTEPPPARPSSAETRSVEARSSETARPDPSPSPFRLREIPTVHVCERCGTTMYDHHCKIVCPNCGYKRDCSDP